MRVALLGLGVMGAGMAGHLLKHGHTLTVYNRTTTKAAPLAAQGAHLASIPREAAESAEVIIAMVGDDRASRAIWLGDDGALAGARSGTVLVECSTLSLGWVRELGIAAAERGLAFLDSPVTGSKDGAQAGSRRRCQLGIRTSVCCSHANVSKLNGRAVRPKNLRNSATSTPFVTRPLRPLIPLLLACASWFHASGATPGNPMAG